MARIGPGVTIGIPPMEEELMVAAPTLPEEVEVVMDPESEVVELSPIEFAA